jgi:hypothetical protein
MDWVKVGAVKHYFDRIGVAVVELQDDLAVGDWIALARGEELLFEQEVVTMQIERQSISSAQAGEDVGLQVNQKVKAGTEVYKRVQ